jgi:nucleoredoxin
MKRFAVLVLGLCSSVFAQETLTIETVAADRKIWPREVTVSVPHDVPVIVNGKVSGSMKATAGRTYPVKSVSATGVVIDALGAPLTFAPADTDVLARAEQLKARQAAIAAAAPPAPVATATPAKPAATPPPAAENAISKALSGKLVALDGKKLSRFDASALGGKKFFAIYRSASWCGPCRAFTPDLVSFYKRKKADHDKFEVIFVSSDRSEDDMVAYMTEDNMAWPAVDYDKRGDRLPITGHGGRGIPDLLIMDADGNVLSRSYEGETYVGPRKVLKDLEDLLKKS